MLNKLAKLAYRLFGRIVYRHRKEFEWLHNDLRSARIPLSLDEYVSLIILLIMLTPFVAFVPLYLLFYGMAKPVAFILSVVGAIGVSVILILYFLNYPRIVAASRASSIDMALPAAVTHMATLAGTGIPPHHMFRILSKIKKYGEVAKECGYIYRDVAVLGKDIFSAISDAARVSPSRLWAEVLWGISSTLRAGGNLRDFLYSKSRELYSLLEQQERKAVQTMNLLTDIYMVIFVLGPILSAIILIIVSTFGGGKVAGFDPLTVLMLMTYFALPVGGLIFLLLADMIRPREIA